MAFFAWYEPRNCVYLLFVYGICTCVFQAAHYNQPVWVFCLETRDFGSTKRRWHNSLTLSCQPSAPPQVSYELEIRVCSSYLFFMREGPCSHMLDCGTFAGNEQHVVLACNNMLDNTKLHGVVERRRTLENKASQSLHHGTWWLCCKHQLYVMSPSVDLVRINI